VEEEEECAISSVALRRLRSLDGRCRRPRIADEARSIRTSENGGPRACNGARTSGKEERGEVKASGSAAYEARHTRAAARTERSHLRFTRVIFRPCREACASYVAALQRFLPVDRIVEEMISKRKEPRRSVS